MEALLDRFVGDGQNAHLRNPRVPSDAARAHSFRMFWTHKNAHLRNTHSHSIGERGGLVVGGCSLQTCVSPPGGSRLTIHPSALSQARPNPPSASARGWSGGAAVVAGDRGGRRARALTQGGRTEEGREGVPRTPGTRRHSAPRSLCIVDHPNPLFCDPPFPARVSRRPAPLCTPSQTPSVTASCRAALKAPGGTGGGCATGGQTMRTCAIPGGLEVFCALLVHQPPARCSIPQRVQSALFWLLVTGPQTPCGEVVFKRSGRHSGGSAGVSNPVAGVCAKHQKK